MPEKKKKNIKATAHMNFPKGAAFKLDGFDGASIDEKVIITLEGKVVSLSNIQNEWENSKSIDMELTSCRIIPAQKGVNLDQMFPTMKGEKKNAEGS